MNTIDVSSNGIPGFGGFGWGGGFGGGGLVEGLLLGTIFNRRGWGGDDCCGDRGSYSRDGFGTGAANLSYLMGKSAGEDAKYRDVVDATTAINDVAREGFNFSNLAIERVRDGVAAGFTALGQEVCDNKYAALIQFKDLASQLAASTCEIKRTVETDGDATRALINAQAQQTLRDQLEEARRQRDLLATGNFPISQPAHVHRHHCSSQEDGVQVQINNVNQNVQALGSVVGQIADLVNRLNSQLAKQA